MLPVPFEYTPVVERPNVYSPAPRDITAPAIVIRYDPKALEAIHFLQTKLSSLERKIDSLTKFIREKMDQDASSLNRRKKSPALSDEDILVKAKEIFDTAGDETVYPSDLAGNLQISYEKAVEIFEELERVGKIKRA